MNDDFEEQLRPDRSARCRPIGATRFCRPPLARLRLLRTQRGAAIIDWIASWLWPHPRAWGALAGAWLVILLLRAASPPMPRSAANDWASSGQSLAVYSQQEVAIARLLEAGEPPPVAPAAPAPPKPHSERPMPRLAG